MLLPQRKRVVFTLNVTQYVTKSVSKRVSSDWSIFFILKFLRNLIRDVVVFLVLLSLCCGVFCVFSFLFPRLFLVRVPICCTNLLECQFSVVDIHLLRSVLFCCCCCCCAVFCHDVLCCAVTALCRVVLCFAVGFCDSLLDMCVVLLLLLQFDCCSYCFCCCMSRVCECCA